MKVTWKDTAQVDEMEIAPHLERAVQYNERLKAVWKKGGYDAPESSLNLPFDTTLLEIRARAHEMLAVSKLKYILVIGIGGSSLGSEAVYAALRGFIDHLEPEAFPRLIFLDTLESEYMERLLKVLEQNVRAVQEIAVLIVSKSGTTTETLGNTAVIFQFLKTKFSDIASRAVVITDGGSPLDTFADREGIKSVFIPTKVGGRYSVFSAAGLFPLALMGIDIRELRAGACEVVSSTLDTGDTTVHETAAVLAHFHGRGLAVHDTFLFNPRLEVLGKWYRQLLAESVGKERVVAGAIARVGFTPTVSVGTVDLHSMAQLYFAGPRERVSTLVKVERGGPEVEVSYKGIAEIVPAVKGRSFEEILHATYGGVKETYRKQKLPFMEVTLDRISARELGAFMQYKMLETMHLAHLLDVNAFDQPAVEYYKEETRRLLGS